MYIRVSDLSLKENGRAIFENLNFEIFENETVALVGDGGSELLKMIAGRCVYDSGYIMVDNLINKVPQKMVFLSKDYSLIPTKTVAENLLVPLRLQCVDKQICLEKVEKALYEFSLYDYRNFYPRWLSPNLIGLTAFAEATLFDWELYLFDDPFARLDPNSKALCYGKLRELREKGKTIVFTTSDSYETSVLATRSIDLGTKALSHK